MIITFSIIKLQLNVKCFQVYSTHVLTLRLLSAVIWDVPVQLYIIMFEISDQMKINEIIGSIEKQRDVYI